MARKRLRATDYSLKQCLVADLTRFVTSRNFVRPAPLHETRKQKQLRVASPRGIWRVLALHSDNLSYGKLLMQAVVSELFTNAGFTNPEDASTAKQVAATIRGSCSFMAQARSKAWAAKCFKDGPLEKCLAKGSTTVEGAGNDDIDGKAADLEEVDSESSVVPVSSSPAAPVTPGAIDVEKTEFVYGWSKQMAQAWRSVFIEGVIGPRQYTSHVEEADAGSQQPIVAVWPDGHRAEIYDLRQREYCQLSAAAEVKEATKYEVGWAVDAWAAYRCRLEKGKVGKRELTKMVEVQSDLEEGVIAQWPDGFQAVIHQMPGSLWKAKLEQAEAKAVAAKARDAKVMKRPAASDMATGEEQQPTKVDRVNQRVRLGDGRSCWIRSKHCRSHLWQIVVDGRSFCQVRKSIPGAFDLAKQLTNMLIAGETSEDDLLSKRDELLEAKSPGQRQGKRWRVGSMKPTKEAKAKVDTTTTNSAAAAASDDEPMCLPELW